SQQILEVEAAPRGDELVGVEVDEVVAQQLEQLGGLLGGEVPVQDHLAVVDRDDLDPVQAPAVGHERRLQSAARPEQLKPPVCLHRRAPVASSAATASSSS